MVLFARRIGIIQSYTVILAFFVILTSSLLIYNHFNRLHSVDSLHSVSQSLDFWLFLTIDEIGTVSPSLLALLAPRG